MTDIPEKLDPIEGLDRSLLPAWIDDVGTFRCDEYPAPVLVMKAHSGGVVHHVTGLLNEDFDDTFWQRYAAPMVNCLGGALFEAEHPGKTMPSFLWDAASFYGDKLNLTEEQVAIIARRKELTWDCPIRVFPD